MTETCFIMSSEKNSAGFQRNSGNFMFIGEGPKQKVSMNFIFSEKKKFKVV
jgi:hypothetical protein